MYQTISNKITKSILVFILFLMFFTALQFAVTWNKPNDAQAWGGGLTVFFKKPGWWNAPRIHYWNPQGNTSCSSPCADWNNRLAMTQISDNWWAFNFPSGVTGANIIFTNGWSGGVDHQTQTLWRAAGSADSWFNGWAGNPSTLGDSQWSTSNPDTDTTAPTFSGTIWVTGNTKNGTAITLNWNSSTDSSGIDKYEILRDGVVATTVFASTQNTSSSSYRSGVSAYAIPASYNVAQIGLSATTTYSYQVRAIDYKGISVTSSALIVTPGAYTRSNSVDGSSTGWIGNEIADSNEIFATSSAGYLSYVTYNANDLFFGYSGSDFNTSATTTKWVVLYIGLPGVSGTTTGIGMGTQTAPTLPFPAKYYLQVRSDNGSYFGRVWNGTDWNTSITVGSASKNTMLEFSVPRITLGNPTNLRVASAVYVTQAGSEWTYATTPSNLIVADGFNPTYNRNYYQFDMTSSLAPAAQVYNSNFVFSSKTSKSVTFGMSNLNASNLTIQQSTDNSTWTNSTGATNISGTSTSATITGLTPNTPYYFRLVVTGGAYAGTHATVLYVTTNANSSPTNISLSSSSIAENNDANAVVGNLSTTDIDTLDTFTYSLVNGSGDTDNAAFNINGNELRVTNANSLNFESKSSYSVRVQTSDGSLTFVRALAITVSNVNEAPTDVTLNTSTIAENNATNAVVGTLSGVDPDAGSTLLYSLVVGSGDTDNGNFNISGASLRAIASFDFESKSSYNIRVQVSDGTLSFAKAFTITVTDVNEKPSISVAIANGNAQLNWGAISGANSYNVYLNGGLLASGITSTTYQLTTTTWKIDRLYPLTVRAVTNGLVQQSSDSVNGYKPAGGNVRMISSGWQHGLALMADGTIREWGANDRGQLGAPAGLSGVVAVSAGRFHNVALKADGTVVAWGRNGDGQTNVPNGLMNVVAIAAGGYHSVAVKADGTVVAWGFNGNEISTNVSVSTVPPEISNAIDVAAGTFHTIVLKADGTVTGWGLNTSGQINVPSGLNGVTELGANGNFSVALKSDGTVTAWGANESGQTNLPAALTNPASANVTSISAGGQHAVARKSDGTLISWGRAVEGQISGTNGKTNVTDVAAGSNFTIMLIGNSALETTTQFQLVNTLLPTGLGGDLTAPTAPTNLQLVDEKDSGVMIAWTASTDNVAVTGYRILVNGISVKTVSGSVTQTEVFGLSPVLTSIRVVAFDEKGNVSPLSNELSVTLSDKVSPSTPTGLSTSLLRANSFLFSWTAATDNIAVTRYNVYRDGALVATVTGTSYRFFGLTDITNYSVGVLALDAVGNRSPQANLNVTTPDGTAPTAPSTVTSSNVLKDRFRVQWSGATDNVGVTRYNVYLNGVYARTVSGTMTDFINLTSNTQYVVRIQAIDVVGNRSVLSNSITVTTLDGSAPSVPSGLVASNITKTGFRVAWNASTDNGVLTKYNVYRNGAYVQTVTGTSYTFSGLTINQTHSITVLAIDDANNRSALSAPLSVTTTFVSDPVAPTAPTNLASSNVTTTGFRVTWTAASDNVAVTNYNIYRNGSYVGTVAGTATLRFNVSGLTAGTAHSIVVRAIDAEGNFTNSVALSVTTLP